MDKTLSLLNFCKKCQAKCCKTDGLIGSPILSIEEFERISVKDQPFIREETSPVGEKYWIIADQKTNNCHFLNSRNECEIQDAKPLDCLCYPIKAIWRNDKIIYVIDTACPAAGNLSPEFVNKAKAIALQSIKRFKKETYNHWAKNNVGWLKKTAKCGKI